MRQPQDAPPALGELQAHALADAAESGEFVMGEQFHVAGLIGHGAFAFILLVDCLC
jgi:hypothetical protein